jgi:hypothetical protein
MASDENFPRRIDFAIFARRGTQPAADVIAGRHSGWAGAAGSAAQTRSGEG